MSSSAVKDAAAIAKAWGAAVILLFALQARSRTADATRLQPHSTGSSEINAEPSQTAQPGSSLQFLPQRASAMVTWLASDGHDGLGMFGLGVSTTFARPIPWISAVVTVSPAFDVQFVEAPDLLMIPSELYRGSLTFSAMKVFNERTQLMAGVTPSFASDLEANGSDAFRLVAFAAASWQWNPTTKLTIGGVATGRGDIPVLPMAGLTWTPTEDWKIGIAAPRPRIARRVNWFEPSGDDWIYVAGEMGGGTWAVDRAGRDDELTIRDFRVVVGWERLATGGLNMRLETGYVFGRKIEYDSGNPDVNPNDTIMLRIGGTH